MPDSLRHAMNSVRTLLWPRRNTLLRCTFFRRYYSSGPEWWSEQGFLQRMKTLNEHHRDKSNVSDLLYPRWQNRGSTWSIRDFVAKYAQKTREELENECFSSPIELHGQVKSVRKSGNKLVFIDINSENSSVQIMCNLRQLQRNGLEGDETFHAFRKSIAIGDFYAFAGTPSRSDTGELCLGIDQVPILLAPRLNVVPTQVSDEETIARFPQLDLLLNGAKVQNLQLRHVLEKSIRSFLDGKGFTGVSTPILGADTGGAVAKPFETSANEFSSKALKLRIAQELELKKLVAANMGGVYEIGPCFRNEGIDHTHNPEFTTCEFYQPYKNLEDLIEMTQNLFHELQVSARNFQETLNLPVPAPQFSQALFPRIEFLPTLERLIRQKVPEFYFPSPLADTNPTCLSALTTLLPQLGIQTPSTPSIARMLDALSCRFLEPQCTQPTFITGYPALLSPLAKSYVCPDTGHVVAARAELFVGGVEVANMYEEENSPFEQAKKFLLQNKRNETASDGGMGGEKGSEASHGFSEADISSMSHTQICKKLSPGQRYYVKVLELGLPPTAGWGCGIERLVMLFGGAKRIADVLPFGTLRNVVAMGTEGR